MKSLFDLFATGLEAVRVLWLLPSVNRGLRLLGPKALVKKMRQRSRFALRRDALGRSRLRRAIGWVDSRLPGSNCYRRALLEMGLDAGAAAEPLWMGLHLAGDKVTGHAWIAAEASGADEYQVAFRI